MSSAPTFTLQSSPVSVAPGVFVCLVRQRDTLAGLDALLPAAVVPIREALARGEFQGKPCELLFAHAAPERARVMAVGLGPGEALSPERWRRAAAAGALAAAVRKFGAITLVAPAAGPDDVTAIVDGVTTANFDAGSYRTAERENVAIESVRVIVEQVRDGLQAAVDLGEVQGRAVNTARALANEPGNVLSPRVLGERASAIAAASGLACDVLDETALEALGMRLLLGVGRGSAEPPRLIVMRYEPENPASASTLALVGKGVTFDTGGISIKPSEKMELMKYDMAGGAAVVGAMQAIAALRPGVRVVGIVPAAENMPGGRALRPGDVLRGASGKTVEVHNTDAEGRLLLADALWYARERAGATHLVDVATLTGACVVALGRFNSGLFGNDEAWASRVKAAAGRAGDRVWPMPLDEDYAELLRSDIADLVNIGGRAAGAITAAKFLQAFAGDTPWVHLDVAGTAWLDEAQPWMPKGPTGVMTRTMVHLALARDW